MLNFEGLGFRRLARSVRKSCDLAGKCCFPLVTHICRCPFTGLKQKENITSFVLMKVTQNGLKT